MHGFLGWLGEAGCFCKGVRVDEGGDEDSYEHYWEGVGDEVVEGWEGGKGVHGGLRKRLR